MMTEYIRVVAPATLEENFTFDVLLNGKPFTVVVPAGGVAKGEEFEVPYPRDDGDDYKKDDGDGNNNDNRDDIERTDSDDLALPPTMSNSSDEDDHSTDENDRLGAPYGRFRVSLCSCCDVLTQATFWMALCCFPVLLAQVLTRLRLKWNGQEIEKEQDDDDFTCTDKNYQQHESEEENAMTFNKIVLAFVGVLALGHIPLVGSVIVFVFYMVTMIWIGGNLRRYVRRRYKIPRTCSMCPGDVEDRCTMGFCGCCAMIQIARHTHNDKEYPGYCCTTTGLELGAPQLLPTYRTSVMEERKATN